MDTWWSFEFFFCLSFRLLFSCVYVFEEDHTCKVVNFFFSLFSLGSFLFEFLFFLHFVTLGFVVVDVNFLLIYTTFAITRRKRVVYIVYIFFFAGFSLLTQLVNIQLKTIFWISSSHSKVNQEFFIPSILISIKAVIIVQRNDSNDLFFYFVKNNSFICVCV